MTSLKPIKDATEHRMQQVIVVADNALGILKIRHQIPVTVQAEVEDQITHFFPTSSPTRLTAETSTQLDARGCALWNAATNLQREGENDANHRHHAHLIVLLRVFAFFLLNTAFLACGRQKRREDAAIRDFKIGIRACRSSLENDQLELALKVLEQIAPHLSPSNTPSNDHTTACAPALEVEHYLLRVMHSWKSDRLDLATHFSNKIAVEQFATSIELAEKAADLFYEIGRSLLNRTSAEAAIAWLNRARDVLNTCETEHLSTVDNEMQLMIAAALVEAFLLVNDAASLGHARRLVDSLDASHGLGDRLAIQVMHFNIVAAEQPVETERIREVLARMVRSVLLTENTFGM